MKSIIREEAWWKSKRLKTSADSWEDLVAEHCGFEWQEEEEVEKEVEDEKVEECKTWSCCRRSVSWASASIYTHPPVTQRPLQLLLIPQTTILSSSLGFIWPLFFQTFRFLQTRHLFCPLWNDECHSSSSIQSCKMSRIWRIYPSKKIGKFG